MAESVEHCEGRLATFDALSDLLDLFRVDMSQEHACFGNVVDLLRPEAHYASTGGVYGDRIVSED
jgi:hypothetical protein